MLQSCPEPRVDRQHATAAHAYTCGVLGDPWAETQSVTRSAWPAIWSVTSLAPLMPYHLIPSEVVYAFVSLGGAPSTSDEVLLDDEERRQSRRFVRRTYCTRFVLVHVALRLILSRTLGVEPATVFYERGVHGKPRLGPAFRGSSSISPTRGSWCCSRRSRSICRGRPRVCARSTRCTRDRRRALLGCGSGETRAPLLEVERAENGVLQLLGRARRQ